MDKRYAQFLPYPRTYLATVRNELNELAIKQAIKGVQVESGKKGFLKGYQRGMSQAFHEGEESRTYDIALKMFASQKYTLEEIAKVTNLDFGEVTKFSQ